jgi:hypothetical protein
MKKMKLIAYGIGLLGLCSACLAGNPGDVTLVNNNQATLGSQDELQFQLVTNGNGLVTSGALSASPPNNTQTLDHWSFSDQTQGFTIYVRDISLKQAEYIPCSQYISYSPTLAAMTVYGYSDGTITECKIQSLFTT